MISQDVVAAAYPIQRLHQVQQHVPAKLRGMQQVLDGQLEVLPETVVPVNEPALSLKPR